MMRTVSATDRRPLSEQVADALTARILEQNLVPGDRLPTEPELIEEFDVSRTVIREAGRTLVARGIVSIRPRRGMTVAEFDESNLARQMGLMLRLGGGSFTQLMEVRRALEPSMAAYAAMRRTDADVEELERLLSELRDDGPGRESGRPRSEAEDLRAHIEADLEFHAAIARATGNPFFEHIVLPVNEILFATYSSSPGYTPERGKTEAEHERIAQAIADGDPERARISTLEHIGRVNAAVETLVPGASAGSAGRAENGMAASWPDEGRGSR